MANYDLRAAGGSVAKGFQFAAQGQPAGAVCMALQLVGAVVRLGWFESGSKLHALQTLRASRLWLGGVGQNGEVGIAAKLGSAVKHVGQDGP